MSFNIGDEIVYNDVYGDRKSGVIVEVSSDMDSYEDMKLVDGVPFYASKKLTAAAKKRSGSSDIVYAPVKPKNMDTVFVEVSRKGLDYADYVPIKEVECG
jgi:hypothetical protein